MLRGAEERNRRMLRARDTMDRSFAQPLDIPALARVAHLSPAHFSRQFRATFGETPHRYLQRRRVERAMELLRETGWPVTEVCFDVGFVSLATVRAPVGQAPPGSTADVGHLDLPCCRAVRPFGRVAVRAGAPGRAQARFELSVVDPRAQHRAQIDAS